MSIGWVARQHRELRLISTKWVKGLPCYQQELKANTNQMGKATPWLPAAEVLRETPYQLKNSMGKKAVLRVAIFGHIDPIIAVSILNISYNCFFFYINNGICMH